MTEFRFIHRPIVVSALFVGLTASLACGSNAPSPDANPSVEQAAGVGGASNDAAGSGGQSAGGRAAGGHDTTGAGGGDAPCEHTGPPLLDVTLLGECGPSCGGAHCVPSSLVPSDQTGDLATCDAGGGLGYCLPDVMIETGGKFVPDSCVSFDEGVCVSRCTDVPQGLLSLDCPKSHACVSCVFSPDTPGC